MTFEKRSRVRVLPPAAAARPWLLGLAGSAALAVSLELVARGAVPGDAMWRLLARLALDANLLVAAMVAAVVARRRARRR